MRDSHSRQRRFYAARLRNTRSRDRQAFDERFGFQALDYEWVPPEVNLDLFEPNTYPAAAPRALPTPVNQVTCRTWRELLDVVTNLKESVDGIRVLLDSVREVGAIEMEFDRFRERFRHLLEAEGDTIVVATPSWAAWALFDVFSLGHHDFRVDVVLRGKWADYVTVPSPPHHTHNP